MCVIVRGCDDQRGFEERWHPKQEPMGKGGSMAMGQPVPEPLFSSFLKYLVYSHQPKNGIFKWQSPARLAWKFTVIFLKEISMPND